MLGVGTIYMIISLLLMLVSLINRDLVPGGTDYLFFVLIGVLSLKTMIGNRELNYPKYYIGILLPFLLVILFNSFISPYSPGFLYIAISTFVTVIPFLTFLFSYNIRFTSEEIDKYIDMVILVACILAIFIYIEFILFNPPTLDSIITSEIIMIGFFASFCSQTIVLCLARYHVTRSKKYIFAIIFLLLTIFLLNQLKAIIGGGLAIVAYLLFMTRMNSILKLVMLSLGATAFAVWIAVSGSLMIEKATKYTEYLADDDAAEGVARIALYIKSVEIADDFFPLGTGQGTFGSIPVNIIYSNVYYDYELSDIWGLAENDRVNFKMDTHWASVLGEMGVLGLIIYIILLFYPVIAIGRLVKRQTDITQEMRAYRFCITCGMSILVIESFVLALPNRFCFILIYAGLSAIIMRNQYTSEENLLDYEDSADND